MTIGTAIVVSIGIICVTFLAVMGIGAWLACKQRRNATEVANEIIKKRLNKQ